MISKRLSSTKELLKIMQDEHFALVQQYLPWATIPIGLYALSKVLIWAVPGPQHNSNLQFKDKTIVITGASSGLGRTLAIHLHREGAKLILLARSLDKLKELCEELKKMHKENTHEPVYRYLDIADVGDLADLANLSIDGKTIDILINNAGSSMRGAIEDTPMEIHRQLMEVNYFGHVAVTKALLPFIPDSGSIIVISSMQGKIPVPYRSAYSASKHALQAFFDTLRSENRHKLHILTVSAGYMNTGFGSRALETSGQPTGKEDKNQLKFRVGIAAQQDSRGVLWVGQVAGSNGMLHSEKGYSVDFSAETILKAAKRRQTELILAPFVHRFAIFLRWVWPNLFHYAMYKRGLKDEYAKKTE